MGFCVDCYVNQIYVVILPPLEANILAYEKLIIIDVSYLIQRHKARQDGLISI